ncbi:hypothetical protein KQX54_006953 [Cotesia glomerata]|uniref:Uncharacterized protein n=1 Tax=Cotesia glomerata TaxID=32391 RepID=A0AAV7I7K8_COTGL|nr:hypothetical protein KQX54_006953 [Cotesia glomerata]
MGHSPLAFSADREERESVGGTRISILQPDGFARLRIFKLLLLHSYLYRKPPFLMLGALPFRLTSKRIPWKELVFIPSWNGKRENDLLVFSSVPGYFRLNFMPSPIIQTMWN